MKRPSVAQLDSDSRNPVPTGWCWAAVEDVIELCQYGSSAKTLEEAAGVPVIRMGNIQDGYLDLANLKYLPSEHDEFPKLLLQDGDLLFNRTNSAELVGKSAIYNGTPTPCSYASYLVALRMAKSCSSKYLCFYLNSQFGRTWIRTVVSQQVGQANVNSTKLRAMRFPLAPLNEQRRIVAKIEELFSDLDAGVAALRRAKANLKRYRAAVLKAAVEGDLTADWRAQHPNTEPASQLLTRILQQRREKWEADQLTKFQSAGKDPPKNWWEKYVEPTPPDTNGLPELPKGWCWASVEQTSEVQGGIQKQPKRTPRSNSFPFLRVANVHRNRLELDEVHRIELFGSELERLRLQPNDLLVVEGNGSKTEIGRSAIWNGEIVDCVHQNHIIRVRFLTGSSRYLNAYWNSPSGNGLVMEQAASTSGLYTLSVTKVCSLPVPLAPSAEQDQIVTEVEERLSQIDAAEAAIARDLQRAGRLRQSILQQAFTGQLVPQDPTDEPASTLLERLRTGPRQEDNPAGSSPRRKKASAKKSAPS